MDTILITCTCKVCGGKTARVREALREEVTGESKNARTVRHNMVMLAHSALGRAASVRTFGPWAA